jgi:hypothetical protein
MSLDATPFIAAVHRTHLMPRLFLVTSLLLLHAFLVVPSVLAQDAEGSSLPEAELPEPPENFSWQMLDKIKAAFLLPDGWNFLEQQSGETQAYFLTRENIEEQGSFSTGLSINVVPNVEEKTGYSAPAYAQAFIAAAGPDTNEEVLERARLGDDVVPGFGVRTRSENQAGQPIIIHRIAFGNSETGTFYLISFESPEARWEQAWEQGEVMLTSFALDRGI